MVEIFDHFQLARNLSLLSSTVQTREREDSQHPAPPLQLCKHASLTPCDRQPPVGLPAPCCFGSTGNGLSQSPKEQPFFSWKPLAEVKQSVPFWQLRLPSIPSPPPWPPHFILWPQPQTQLAFPFTLRTLKNKFGTKPVPAKPSPHTRSVLLLTEMCFSRTREANMLLLWLFPLPGKLLSLAVGGKLLGQVF